MHGLPRAYLLTIRLCEALAKHMLMEFCSKVISAYVEKPAWTETQIKSMRESVVTLAAASGDVTIKDDTNNATSLYDVMQQYCTGTQKSNEWKRPGNLPTVDELGPIVSHLPLRSPENESKSMLHGGGQKSRDKALD